MKFIYKSVEYNFSDWNDEYLQSDSNKVLKETYRSIILKGTTARIRPDLSYFHWSEDKVGIYLPLTSPNIHYKIYGSGLLAEPIRLYNKIYNNSICEAHEIQIIKNQIDNFLNKLSDLTIYL